MGIIKNWLRRNDKAEYQEKTKLWQIKYEYVYKNGNFSGEFYCNPHDDLEYLRKVAEKLYHKLYVHEPLLMDWTTVKLPDNYRSWSVWIEEVKE